MGFTATAYLRYVYNYIHKAPPYGDHVELFRMFRNCIHAVMKPTVKFSNKLFAHVQTVPTLNTWGYVVEPAGGLKNVF